MTIRTAFIVATLALCCVPSGMAASKTEASAAKGPLALRLSLRKTTVKVKRSIWYKLELKNTSKKKIQLYDAIFRDPHAVHVNSNARHGIYFELLNPHGKPVPVKWGEYRVRYDWEGPEGTPWRLTEKETKKLDSLRDEWKKKGLTEQQQSIAESDWFHELSDAKNYAESTDPVHKRWLAPGASTSTVAASLRGPDDYPGRSDDDQALREGYAELWAFRLLTPGKYRIRAVYNYAHSARIKKLFKKDGQPSEPQWIEFKTPFIDVEVVP